MFDEILKNINLMLNKFRMIIIPPKDNNIEWPIVGYDEVLKNIFQYVHIYDLRNLRLVSKKFRKVSIEVTKEIFQELKYLPIEKVERYFDNENECLNFLVRYRQEELIKDMPSSDIIEYVNYTDPGITPDEYEDFLESLREIMNMDVM